MRAVAVLITCHNRKAKTVACLDRLFQQALPQGIELKVYLVDDGCTDGTPAAVQAAHPDVTVIQGGGSLFWCNGMRLAWTRASEADPDYYLWLNDDTILKAGAIEMLLRVATGAAVPACIVVGACCDPSSGELTYTGTILSGRHPVRGLPVTPDPDAAKRCDIFNGNCVLVTRGAYRILGIMRPFMHYSGDTDYGLRARSRGIPVVVAPGFAAECQRNAVDGTWEDQNLSRLERFRLFVGRKGLPPSDWWRLLWTHAGVRALLYWPVPYVRVLLGR